MYLLFFHAVFLSPSDKCVETNYFQITTMVADYLVTSLRHKLVSSFMPKADKYGLYKLTYPIFNCNFNCNVGFRHKFCALDMVHCIQVTLLKLVLYPLQGMRSEPHLIVHKKTNFNERRQKNGPDYDFYLRLFRKCSKIIVSPFFLPLICPFIFNK